MLCHRPSEVVFLVSMLTCKSFLDPSFSPIFQFKIESPCYSAAKVTCRLFSWNSISNPRGSPQGRPPGRPIGASLSQEIPSFNYICQFGSPCYSAAKATCRQFSCTFLSKPPGIPEIPQGRTPRPSSPQKRPICTRSQLPNSRRFMFPLLFQLRLISKPYFPVFLLSLFQLFAVLLTFCHYFLLIDDALQFYKSTQIREMMWSIVWFLLCAFYSMDSM